MTDHDTEKLNTFDTPTGETGALLSVRRKWAFRLVALAIPVVILLALEGALRLAGYGGHPPILADVGVVVGKHYITTLPAGIRPFFVANPAQRGSMDRQFFTMPKDANTVRIVLVGGSAMQGYPQPRQLKLSAFLDAMLRDLWPDRHVEVINLGTTAIASFPVTRIAHAARAYDPDLLIVYSGNNEFYGAGGVASTHRLGRTAVAMRAFHELRRLAVVQALRARRAPPVDAAPAGEGLMDAVLADAQIVADDPRRAAAARNLEDNLRSIVAEYQAKNIPVIVCTCPGSERNLAPIGEDAPLSKDADPARFDQLVRTARARVATAPADALADLDAAAALHPAHATVQYLRGRCLAALGRDREAAAAYVRARDLDTMPWRAPSTSNAAIRRAAADGAVLCDLERAFQEHSPGRSIGWELMDDHVHPALAGQALVARALLRAMGQLPGALRIEPGAVGELPDWESYAERLGANPLDAYRVVYRVTDLFERSFFKRSNPEARRRFLALQGRMEAEMDPVVRSAVKALQSAGYAVPIAGWVAEAQFRAGEYRRAADNLALARRALPPFSYLRIHYGCLETAARRCANVGAESSSLAEELVRDCEIMRALRGSKPVALEAYCGCVCSQAGRHTEAITLLEPSVRALDDPFQPVLAGALADALAADGRTDEAQRLRKEFPLAPDRPK